MITGIWPGRFATYGCGAAVAHLLWEQDVGSSNFSIRTKALGVAQLKQAVVEVHPASGGQGVQLPSSPATAIFRREYENQDIAAGH